MIRIVGLIILAALMGPVAAIGFAYAFANWAIVLDGVGIAFGLFVVAVIISGVRQGASERRSASMVDPDGDSRRAFGAYASARGEIGATYAPLPLRTRRNYDPLPMGGPINLKYQR